VYPERIYQFDALTATSAVVPSYISSVVFGKDLT
jgi:hypothetical protein